MKTAVILLGLFVAFVAAEEESPLKKLYAESFKKCNESMKPSEEILELVETNAYEDNKEAQCFEACLSIEMGLMIDAKFDIEKLEKLIRSDGNMPQKHIEITIGLLKACKAEAEVTDDKCEVMGNYLKCTKAKAAAFSKGAK